MEIWKKELSGLTIALVLIAFALFIWGISDIGDKTSATAIGTVNTSGYLNVRKGPGKSYACLKVGGTRVTLSNGTNVTIIAKSNKWYKIRFKYNGSKLKGYVMARYLSVMSGDVCTQINGVVRPTAISVRTAAGNGKPVMYVGGKAIKLPVKKKVTILAETYASHVKWYRVAFSDGKVKRKGYIKADAVVLQFPSAIPGLVKTSGVVTLKKKAGKMSPVRIKGSAIFMVNQTQILLLGEKTVSGVKYFQIQVSMSKKDYIGYLAANNVNLQQVKMEAAATPTPTPTPEVTPTPKPKATPKATAKATATPNANTSKVDVSSMNQSEFKKYLKNQGFPDSYITSLLGIHTTYPKWDFRIDNTGLEWSDVVSNESKVGLNLLNVNKSSEWKSYEAGAYDASTDKFIPYDGSTWVTASVKAVEYYLDPRNFMDEDAIFQFESLEYQKGSQTEAGVESLLNNTPMHNTEYQFTTDSGESRKITYAKIFMEAAQESGVSPYHLASRVKQEVVTSATSMSSSVSGTVSGYEGIYNFYNIGANNSTVPGGAVANGLTFASKDNTYLRPWNNHYKALVGGAQYIGNNYINVGQDTLYLQKFNVTQTNTYDHQYMSNIEAPTSEGNRNATAYGDNKKTMSIVFSIPVYNNMPDKACPIPSGGQNSNNYLKSLSVSGYTLSPKYKSGADGSTTYKLTVKKSVKTVTIGAKTISSDATVTSGIGKKKLKIGKKTYTIKVKSESGSIRKYKIQITRKKK